MLTVIVPLKPIDTVRLKAELVAAGVEAWPAPLAEPSYAGSAMMAVIVPDRSDPAMVAQVVAAHKDERTPAQIKREQSAASLGADDPTTIRLRAVVRVLFASLVETRNWCNQMRQQLQAAGMPTPPKVVNRTWEEAMQAVLAQINAEVLDGLPEGFRGEGGDRHVLS